MALTGHQRQCVAKASGVAELHVAKRTEIASFTKSASGSAWTAYTKADGITGNVFKKYEFKPGEADFKPVLSRPNGANSVTNTITLYKDNFSSATRDAVQNLADESNCGLIAIVVTNNGDKWVVGYDSKFGSTYYAEMTESSGDAGKAFEDAQGFTSTISNKTVELPCVYTGEINPA